MTFPIVSSLTAGVILIFQMILMYTVGATRGRLSQSLGDGGKEEMLRVVRRHGNLAENAGLFIAGLALLEMIGGNRIAVIVMCAAFVVVRVLHALGLSQPNTNNSMRGIGFLGTLVVGAALGCYLVWIAGSSLARF